MSPLPPEWHAPIGAHDPINDGPTPQFGEPDTNAPTRATADRVEQERSAFQDALDAMHSNTTRWTIP